MERHFLDTETKACEIQSKMACMKTVSLRLYVRHILASMFTKQAYNLLINFIYPCFKIYFKKMKFQIIYINFKIIFIFLYK